MSSPDPIVDYHPKAPLLLEETAEDGLTLPEFKRAFRDPVVSQKGRLTDEARRWLETYVERCRPADQALEKVLAGRTGKRIGIDTGSLRNSIVRCASEAGKRLFKEKDYAGAAREFVRAYRWDRRPSHAFNAAQSYLRDNRLPEAISWFSTYLEKAPSNAKKRSWVGKTITDLKQAQEKASRAWDLTVVGDMTLLMADGRFKGGNPAFSGSLYQENGFHGNLEIEGTFKTPWVSGLVDLAIGNNARVVQSVGMGGEQTNLDDRYPFDLLQAYLQLCPPKTPLCVGIGKRATAMGMDVFRADQRDFPLPDPHFTMIPYFDTSLWVRLAAPWGSLMVGMSPGPDRLPIFGDPNRVPFLQANGTLSLGPFFVFANYQAGPDQDDNTQYWKHMWDLGATFEKSIWTARFYGLIGREDFEAGPQFWGVVNTTLKVRPLKYFDMVAKVGYLKDDGARTGVTDLEAVQVTAGATVYLWHDFVRIRLQTDYMRSINGGLSFGSDETGKRDDQWRGTLQLVFGGSIRDFIRRIKPKP